MIQRRFHHIVISCILALLLAGCAEYDFPWTGPGEGEVVISLSGGEATRSIESPDDLSAATESERRINHLYYFFFPREDGLGSLRGMLTPPTPDESANEAYKDYVIKNVTGGKYRVYVIANMPECVRCNTEDQLLSIILNYRQDNLPVPGDIPMVYEGDATVSKDGSVVRANLQFTCVKVKYNIIFDKTSQEVFGKSGIMLTGVNGLRLSQSTPLILGKKMKDMVSTENVFDSPLPQGRYYAGWSRNDSPAPDRDVITADNEAGAPLSFNDRWVYQGTLYLPERYVRNDNGQSVLHFTGTMVDASLAPNQNGSVEGVTPIGPKVEYDINLGHTDREGQPRQFPRSTYYEIIGEIRNRDFTALEAEVRVRDWVPVNIAGFRHTTLSVNKTRGAVTSIDADSIRFDTNAPEVILGCDEQLDGLPVIVESKLNKETNTISFCINPGIPIESFKEGTQFPPKGKTTMWLQANNVRKYIDVDYEVVPLFEVTPHSTTISWIDDSSQAVLTRVYSYRTNLGGIKSDHFEKNNISGQSKIFIHCPDPKAAVGTITVTALQNPVNTTEHYWTVSPMKDAYSNMAIQLMTTVKPPLGDYRIHFRVINDSQGNDDNSDKAVPFNIEGNTYLENDWNQWNDWWGGCCMYAYTQFGETENNTIPEYFVWKFTPAYPGTVTRADKSSPNVGWYDFTLGFNQYGENQEDHSKRKVTPGSTLLMFCKYLSDNNYNNKRRHRCPHHLDPGIQLFDYEDREGWYLYDPLCSPYYKTFDDKPQIDNVTYTIYSQGRYPVEWYIPYGKAGQNADLFFHIAIGNLRCENIGNGWYKYSFKAKAPRGDYAKSIIFNFSNNTSSKIFGGANYVTGNSEATGTLYSDGTWQKGEPDFNRPLTLPSVQNGFRRVFIKASSAEPSHLHSWVRVGTADTADSQWPGRPLNSTIYTGWYYVDIKSTCNYILPSNGSTKLTDDTPVTPGETPLYMEYSGGAIYNISEHPNFQFKRRR